MTKTPQDSEPVEFERTWRVTRWRFAIAFAAILVLRVLPWIGALLRGQASWGDVSELLSLSDVGGILALASVLWAITLGIYLDHRLAARGPGRTMVLHAVGLTVAFFAAIVLVVATAGDSDRGLAMWFVFYVPLAPIAGALGAFVMSLVPGSFAARTAAPIKPSASAST